jgi:hypothetical protein
MWIELTKSTLGFAVFSRENDATDVLLLNIGSWVELVPGHPVEATETILMGPWLSGKYIQAKRPQDIVSRSYADLAQLGRR